MIAIKKHGNEFSEQNIVAKCFEELKDPWTSLTPHPMHAAVVLGFIVIKSSLHHCITASLYVCIVYTLCRECKLEQWTEYHP